jgi:hypothetical protein
MKKTIATALIMLALLHEDWLSCLWQSSDSFWLASGRSSRGSFIPK